MERYDVCIIGGGCVGMATAVSLSRFQLRIALLEKECDVAFGVSKANSGIVHGGFHYPDTTLKGRLELQGNRMFWKLHQELGFPCKQCGILLAAFSQEEIPVLEKLFERGRNNGCKGLELCDKVRTKELESKIAPDVMASLYVPEGGVVEPYKYVFALSELAKENGVEIHTSFRVTHSELTADGRILTSADGRKVSTKWVINCAGLYADEVSALLGGESFRIRPRKGEEYLLDRNSTAYPDKVIFPVPLPHSKGVLVIPTAGGTTMVGPTADLVEDKEDNTTTAESREKIFALAKRMVPAVSERDLITAFSGSRPVMDGNEDFYIAASEKTPGLIQAAGIQSPGLTASPAIGEYICTLLKQEGVEFRLKKNIITTLPAEKKVRELSAEEVDSLSKEDPAWARIVCRCEKISEAEIRRAIRRGHTTVEGIKLYTRAGMGRCQGGFCTSKILKLIAGETALPMEKVTRNGEGSELLYGEFQTLFTAENGKKEENSK